MPGVILSVFYTKKNLNFFKEIKFQIYQAFLNYQRALSGIFLSFALEYQNENYPFPNKKYSK